MAWSSWVVVLALVPACGGKAVIDGDDTSAGGGGSTGAGKIESLVILGTLVFASCQVPSADPLDVQMGLEYFNSGQDALFVFTGGLLREDSGAATTFTVSPGTVTVGPGQGTIELSKNPGSAQGTPGCEWCSETDVALTLSMTIDGVGRTVDENVNSVSCTF